MKLSISLEMLIRACRRQWFSQRNCRLTLIASAIYKHELCKRKSKNQHFYELSSKLFHLSKKN